jgi:flagella basal body P-ring formation protein FlgA
MRCLWFLLAMTLLALPAAASPWQDWDRLRRQAADYLLGQAKAGHPDATARVEMGVVDARLRFPACPAPQFFLPAGSKRWGSGNLGVRCEAPEPWSLYLGYQIQLRGPALVARRPLAARTPLAAADWETRDADYAGDPGSYPRDLGLFPEATLTRPVVAGTPLQIDMLRRPQVVRAGQRVRVVVAGAGFQVSQEGLAQNSAHAGDAVKVKLGDKRFVQGTAQADGSVRVLP